MSLFSKTAFNAVAAMSYLAERYDEGRTRIGSAEIAAARNLPQPLVAKILTILSAAKLVNAVPGPNGGYVLAKQPDRISLADVTFQFDRREPEIACPFGPGYCGTGPHCPLHDAIQDLKERSEAFLKEHHFGIFVRDPNALAALLQDSSPSI